MRWSSARVQLWRRAGEAAREYNAVITGLLGRAYAGERITLDTS